jgi:AcrR family transcriptional regulator
MQATALSRRGQRAATPRQGDQRERAILDATRELLDDAPLSALTVGRIAIAAAVPRSSLYFYFADKTQIFEVLLADVLRQMSAEVERWLSDPLNLSESWLRSSVAVALEVGRQNAGVLRAATDSRGVHAGIDRVCREYFERSVERATLLIERDRHAGLAPDDGLPARAIARALMLMTERSIYDLLRSGQADAAAAKLIDTLTVLWARGVGTQPA